MVAGYETYDICNLLSIMLWCMIVEQYITSQQKGRNKPEFLL